MHTGGPLKTRIIAEELKKQYKSQQWPMSTGQHLLDTVGRSTYELAVFTKPIHLQVRANPRMEENWAHSHVPSHLMNGYYYFPGEERQFSRRGKTVFSMTMYALCTNNAVV